MKSMRLVRWVVLGAVAIVLAASHGMAQDFKGSFKLPVEARWGSVDLRPGNYKLAIQTGGNFPLVRLESESGKTMLVVAMFREDRPVNNESMLTLKDVDGKYFIRTLDAAYIGQRLTFRVASHPAPELARSQESDMRVRISENGK